MGEAGVDWLYDPMGQRPRRLLPAVAPQVVGGFRFARVADGADDDGVPVIAPERGWITDPADREPLLAYLTAGATVYETLARSPDAIEPTRRFAVPAGYRTDGEWVWPQAVEYYLREHGVAPEPDLARRIAEQGYRCPEVADERVDAARAALRERAEITTARIAELPPVDPRFAPEVRKVLDRAGWVPGRDVSAFVDRWLADLERQSPALVEDPAIVEVARSILNEFGGLVFDLAGPGRTMALSPFSFYPGRSYPDGEDLPDPWNFAYLGRKLGVRVFPIGRYADGRMDIVVDEQGRVFLAGDVDLALGEDFLQGFVRLVVGERPPTVPAPDTAGDGHR